MAVLLVLAVVQVAEAREKELPVDPELRIGRLENGMTYYIRHNEQPKGRAEFWLLQNTGSLVEEEDERGLAHFIEHIAFQGTRNFPGIDMVDILQNNGISYGRDIKVQVFRSETGEKGSYKRVGTIRRDGSWIDKGLKKNTHYYYALRQVKTVKGGRRT